MRWFADLHIHSKYARACSPQLTPENIDLWSRIKGINLVSTGDFTHPQWFKELREKLEPAGGDLYKVKKSFRINDTRLTNFDNEQTKFIIGTELSCIYKHHDRARRVHHCVYMPSLEVAGKLIDKLNIKGCNLKADGRPIIGVSSQELLKIMLDIDERSVLVPAHIWTPWFAMFGSKSGYDSIEECFGDMSKYIFAVETGLSSDPPMNWRLSQLDKVALLSSSDAHSLQNLGREAVVFDGDDISYDSVWRAVKSASLQALAKEKKTSVLQMSGTLEFFPDEGRYHFDGHRVCQVVMSPEESKRVKNICPKCGKELVIGVMNRVEALADRAVGFVPKNKTKFTSLVELDKIIADALGIRGRKSKAVDKYYWKIISSLGSEFNVLLKVPIKKIEEIAGKNIAEGISRIRNGQVDVKPGYDGEYGRINIFKNTEIASSQSSLF